MRTLDIRNASCLLAAAAVVVPTLAIFATGQDTAESRIDSFVKAEMQRQKIPGISLAVVKDGKALLIKGYGLANIEHQVPVKPETIFQSGSVGKQFTAAAVMLLVEDGKIDLDEKISKYLGEVPESWKNITVRQLLTHTAGMTDEIISIIGKTLDMEADVVIDASGKLVFPGGIDPPSA